MALELFANHPITSVTSGGATTPASGTNETWIVSSPGNFPSSSSGATPPTQFHISDPLASSEIMTVINVSGSTWTVTRGAEGTTPVSHSSGFNVEQVVSAAALTALIQSSTTLGGDLSGSYLPSPTVASIQGVAVSGTPAPGNVLVTTSPTFAAWSALPGTLLASHSYGPGSQATYNVLAAGTTLTIIDGTNLTLSFVVPASGNVDIVVSADWAYASSGLTQATDMFMGIVKHGLVSTIYGLKSWFGNTNSIVAGANSTHRYNLTGLAPGALQIDLAMGMSATSGITFAAFYAVALGGTLNTNPSNPIFIQAFAA